LDEAEKMLGFNHSPLPANRANN